MSDKDQLLSMGFSAARVQDALKQTKNSGLQPALDYLFAHADDPEPTPGSAEEPTAPAAQEGEDEAATIKRLDETTDAVPRSLVCDDCGKKFRSQASAEFHAGKSGHENFSESTEEIKPLTEEEKKAKLEELRAAMALKRAAKSKQDADDAKANEAIRRKAGKDQAQAQADLKLKQAQKDAEERKRDKQLELDARNRVKAQIEADKKARAEKAARDKALREGKALPEATQSSQSVAPKPTSASSASTARLQIRLPQGGQPLTTTVEASTLLSQVASWVVEQKPELNGVGLKFSIPFPRKTFTAADMGKTVKDLELTPSSVLIVSV